MSEQQEQVQRAVPQARYRYLADFSRHDSPNLRKQYRQSLNPSQLSKQRRSSSHQHSSYNSSYKKVQRYGRLSPSCSTFKPQREATQQQFSPYNDRGEKQEQFRLSDELRQENMELRSQLLQSKQVAQSLKAELSRKEVELAKTKENTQADLCYFQKVVSEMAGEIQIVLTKNKILENQLTVVKIRLHEQTRRFEEFTKYDEERKRAEKRREETLKQEETRKAIQQKRRQDFERQQHRLSELVNKTSNHPSTRRSVGKLMTKPPLTHHSRKNQSLQTSKIKIQDEYQSTGRQNCENKRVESLAVGQQPQKQSKKGEELIESILGMQLKITGRQANSLKELWKWLKEVGHSQSCLKRWKPKAQAAAYSNNQKLRQLVKEACSYIQ